MDRSCARLVVAPLQVERYHREVGSHCDDIMGEMAACYQQVKPAGSCKVSTSWRRGADQDQYCVCDRDSSVVFWLFAAHGR